MFVCSMSKFNSTNFSYKYDLEDPLTIKNWIVTMKYECKGNFLIALFGSLYFAGFALGAITLNRLSDLFGRKIISIVSLMGGLISGIVILSQNNVAATYIFLFINGICQSVSTSVIYIYALELVKPRLRETYNMLA